MLIDITPAIKVIRPAGKSVYPYSNSVYIDDEIKTVIDAGAGAKAFADIPTRNIEQVFLSHYHFDHIQGVSFFENARILAAWEEAECYRDEKVYQNHTGRDKWKNLIGKKLESLGDMAEWPEDVPVKPGFQFINIAQYYENGKEYYFGKNKATAIHLPGHTAGHYGFYFEKEGILFSGDMDLAPQGPWYGGNSSDYSDLITSAQKILTVNPRILISSHRRIFDRQRDDIVKLIRDYIRIPRERNEKILGYLAYPARVRDIVHIDGLFPKIAESQYRLFHAMQMTLKHLEWLVKQEMVEELPNGYYRRL